MNNSPIPPATSKVIQTKNIRDHEEHISITEKINLTKKQHQVLNVICNTYRESISQYLEEALLEAMRYDIEEGNFCEALLEMISGDDSKKDNNSSASTTYLAPDLMKSDLDLLKKMKT
jgi:hypothetical protein